MLYVVGCHATGLLYFSIGVSTLGKYAYVTLLWCQKWSGMHMTALYFRKFLLKTLNMPGKGFDSLRPNNGKKKSVANFADIVAGQSCGLLQGP